VNGQELTNKSRMFGVKDQIAAPDNSETIINYREQRKSA
jgi:hypothetical protein